MIRWSNALSSATVFNMFPRNKQENMKMKSKSKNKPTKNFQQRGAAWPQSLHQDAAVCLHRQIRHQRHSINAALSLTLRPQTPRHTL